MRAVFINACHPDTSHVCGLRARAFADALTAMGHQILLLTPPLEETGSGSDASTLAERLDAHDWSQPYRVTGAYRQPSILPALRGGRCPAGLRQALIFWQFLRHGGVYEDWCAGTRPLLPVVADTFRPDIVWAIFGNTGCWQIGQELARRAHCPWIADLKDSWTNFIPAVFRQRLARRYGDAAYMTALSENHSETIAHWLPDQPRTTVYSGISAEFLTTRPDPGVSDKTERLILLTGGTYSLINEARTLFESLARGLRNETPKHAGKTIFTYAGNDADAVKTAAKPLEGLCTIEMLGFIPLERLQALQNRAALNLYIRCPPFHHKVFELFAAGRPILCYPAESTETIELAADVGAQFYSCDSRDALDAAFAQVLRHDAPATGKPDLDRLAHYSWEEQAKTLEGLFRRTLEETTPQ